MKNILTIALVIFTFPLLAQQNKIQQNSNLINSGLNHLNNQVYEVNRTVNGTTTNLNESVNTDKNTTSSLFNLWKSAKAEVKPDGHSPANEASSGQSMEKSRPVSESPATIQTSKTIITINQCNFSALKEIASGLESYPSISRVEKSFSNGIALLSLQHTVSTDEIIFYIDSKIKNRFEIQGFSEGTILLKVKQ